MLGDIGTLPQQAPSTHESSIQAVHYFRTALQCRPTTVDSRSIYLQARDGMGRGSRSFFVSLSVTSFWDLTVQICFKASQRQVVGIVCNWNQFCFTGLRSPWMSSSASEMCPILLYSNIVSMELSWAAATARWPQCNVQSALGRRQVAQRSDGSGCTVSDSFLVELWSIIRFLSGCRWILIRPVDDITPYQLCVILPEGCSTNSRGCCTRASRRCRGLVDSIITLVPLHDITLHYMTWHDIPFQYIALHDMTLHYNTWHYIALHCITLPFLTLH